MKEKRESPIDVYKQRMAGEISRWPYNYWNDSDNLRAVIEYVAELEGVAPPELTTQILQRHQLLTTLNNMYNGSIHELVGTLWPGRWNPDEFTRFPIGWWADARGLDRAFHATVALAKKLGVSVSELKTKDFQENGLGGMVTQLFGQSAPEAVRYVTKRLEEGGAAELAYPEVPEIFVVSEEQTKLLTVDEIAARLEVNSERVRRWIKEGQLAAANVGTEKKPEYRIAPADIQAFLARRRVNPTRK